MKTKNIKAKGKFSLWDWPGSGR